MHAASIVMAVIMQSAGVLKSFNDLKRCSPNPRFKQSSPCYLTLLQCHICLMYAGVRLTYPQGEQHTRSHLTQTKPTCRKVRSCKLRNMHTTNSDKDLHVIEHFPTLSYGIPAALYQMRSQAGLTSATSSPAVSALAGCAGVLVRLLGSGRRVHQTQAPAGPWRCTERAPLADPPVKALLDHSA